MQKIEEPNPGDPSAGLRVTSLISDKVSSGPSGAQAARTVRVRNGGGEFEVRSVDTAKSDNIHVISGANRASKTAVNYGLDSQARKGENLLNTLWEVPFGFP